MAVALTPRQQEALTLAACGLSDNETAERMCLSVYTVRWYWREARQRLKARNMPQAVALAWFFQLIQVDTFLTENGLSGMTGDRPGADGGEFLQGSRVAGSR